MPSTASATVSAWRILVRKMSCESASKVISLLFARVQMSCVVFSRKISVSWPVISSVSHDRVLPINAPISFMAVIWGPSRKVISRIYSPFRARYLVRVGSLYGSDDRL